MKHKTPNADVFKPGSKAGAKPPIQMSEIARRYQPAQPKPKDKPRAGRKA